MTIWIHIFVNSFDEKQSGLMWSIFWDICNSPIVFDQSENEYTFYKSYITKVKKHRHNNTYYVFMFEDILFVQSNFKDFKHLHT